MEGDRDGTGRDGIVSSLFQISVRGVSPELWFNLLLYCGRYHPSLDLFYTQTILLSSLSTTYEFVVSNDVEERQKKGGTD